MMHTHLQRIRRTVVVPLAALLCASLAFAPGSQGGKKKKKSKMPRVAKLLAATDQKLGSGDVQIPGIQAIASDEEDRTLSPYLYVAGGDPEVDLLPLRSTRADVRISGSIARVRIHQVFGNDGDEPIEAVYVFPASTRAAVHDMSMRVGDRKIQATIEKRAKAKKKYEQAKSQGKVASLLDQERPNVFTVRVANIMGGQEVAVDLEYTELVEHEDGVYEFVYPAVVGPRYGGGADPNVDDWIANPYLPEGEKGPYEFDIRVYVKTGLALRDLRSPSHEVDVVFDSDSEAGVQLAGEGGGDRDFILEYRLAGEQIESDVLLYEHEDEKFFLLMMQPPEAPAVDQVLPGEYIFLLDVSGSMSGFPLDTSKKLMGDLLRGLTPQDHFNIVTFAGSAGVLSDSSLPATEGNVQMALEKVDGLYGGGGTELMDGLESAYAIPAVDKENVSRTVVAITDGYVGVEARAFKFIRDHLGEANMFAFGIGSSVNRYLIESMARAGFGEPFVVTDPASAPTEAKRFRRYIGKPVLVQITVTHDGFHAYDTAPGKIPDLMAHRPLVLYGKYAGKSGGTITVRGRTASGEFEQAIEIDPSMVSEANAPIRHLWAREWVRTLTDQMHLLPESKKLEKAITRLGLHYSLMTPFTSFVAVDTVKSSKTGKVKKVKQPLPLPSGVPGLAVPQQGFSGAGMGAGAGGYAMGSVKSSGFGAGSYSFALKGAAAPVVPKLKPAASSVSGSLDKSHIQKVVKKTLESCKKLDQLKKKYSCTTVKLKLTMHFDGDGRLSKLEVDVVSSDSACTDEEKIAHAVDKELTKAFGNKKHTGIENSVVTYPLVLTH